MDNTTSQTPKQLEREDTFKEVYAAPNSHYLGTINPDPKPVVPENYPELSPPTDPEVHKQADTPPSATFLDSPIPVEPVTTEKEVIAAEKPSSKNTWKRRILIAVAIVLIIVAVIVGAVVGTSKNNHDGSEKAPVTRETTASTTSDAPKPTSSNVNVALPDEKDLEIGVTYNATFTHYGTGDGTGGSNCNVPYNACNFFTKPGYAVGVSQNLFGNSKGKGRGPACGTCWFLETAIDASGKPLRRNITAIVNEICPVENGEICAQTNLQDSLNSWEAQVNFNLCIDSGASDGLFGPNADFGLAVGRATRVDCKEWQGQVQKLTVDFS